MTVIEGLKAQFDRDWQMIDQTIDQTDDRPTPENVWRTARRAHMCPARLAYHIAETVDSYIDGVEAFRWGYRFGGDWAGMPSDSLPSRQEAKTKLDEWLDAHSDQSILATPSGHPWCGPNRLELALYMLRHTLHHHGEMHALAVLSGSDTDDWA